MLPNPINSLPIYIIDISNANAITIHPKINGTSVISNVFFRPIRSIKYPLNIHPNGVAADESDAKNTVFFC